MLRPFQDLAKLDLVFRGILVDRDREFGHRSRIHRAHIVFAELRNGDGDGFIQTFRIDINGSSSK